ncbi:histidine--tRNA ligase [Lacticigenium naphthae]|uniref:histidine--tRNA ligase n=1 Tax=Lacticigenium naphthae TaxID=515351 RepID=UPI00040C6552|nr:histidine--tRNA ligase [Lacticigenium naphthae]
MNYQKPKGTADILPSEIAGWDYIETVAKKELAKYGFKEIRTPLFESFDLFSRGVGESSDIVSKEMYDFRDKGNRHLALRPEGTASVVRAYVENKLYAPEIIKPVKLFYKGPMFRYERPQSGRMRQFHQLGVEVFGSKNPATDVETIALAFKLFNSLGLKELKLLVNSLGDSQARVVYRQALIEYLEPFKEELSKDSQIRLYKNPLRVLDSKDKIDKEIVKNAPSILNYLSEDSKRHFSEVQKMLEALNIPYEIDTTMVRGLDYYSDTIFEILTTSKNFGSNTTICAGGRYDGLVEEMGGPETPGFGFAFGLERLLLIMKKEEITIPSEKVLDVYVVGIGEETNLETLKIVEALRANDLNAERDFLFRKPKAQFKTADKSNARLVITIGSSELAEKKARIKNMKTGGEQSISLDEIYSPSFKNIFNLLTSD